MKVLKCFTNQISFEVCQFTLPRPWLGPDQSSQTASERDQTSKTLQAETKVLNKFGGLPLTLPRPWLGPDQSSQTASERDQRSKTLQAETKVLNKFSGLPLTLPRPQRVQDQTSSDHHVY